MNFLAKTFVNVTRNYLRTCVTQNNCGQLQQINRSNVGLFTSFRQNIYSIFEGLQQIREGSSLRKIHEQGGLARKAKKKKNPLGENKPFAKGVVLKTLIKKPKKPNSANRKCVLLRLSTGKEMVAYIPGEGHNLQEHNIVLVRVGRLKDVPGVKIKCVRGKYDLGHVIKKKK